MTVGYAPLLMYYLSMLITQAYSWLSLKEAELIFLFVSSQYQALQAINQHMVVGLNNNIIWSTDIISLNRLSAEFTSTMAYIAGLPLK